VNGLEKIKMKQMIVGIDGEGIGRFPHKYVLLAASDETGTRKWSIEEEEGLHSDECLAFLADLAFDNDIVGFSFAFSYDITKILQDLPDSLVYRIMRPDERKSCDLEHGASMPTEVIYGPFRINYFGSKFTVRRGRREGVRSDEKGLVIWDVYKFFQSSFVKALEDWKVGSDDVEFIQQMKLRRGEFTWEEFPEVKSYCYQECKYLAQLVDKLIKAHDAAGLTLKNFYGAGSTASALLDKLEIKEKVKAEILNSASSSGLLVNWKPLDMDSAVMRAFFGGRFENSIVGPVRQRIYSYDISSAYPYQIYQLPCLEHGLWRYSEDRGELDRARQALVVWSQNLSIARADDYSHVNNRLWGPLPFRYATGTIIFPTNGGSGCTYLPEFLQAEKFGVKFVCAWILENDCDCTPFNDIPYYYNERCRIGKEGPGIVLKLGINACYGKLAQSVGKPQYNSWIWAGMITSGCRAQILEALLTFKDERNLLAIATDGIYSTEKLDLPLPIETNTSGYGKPLGGWEEKIIEGGLFFARPGVNFALKDNHISLSRGRGYGRNIILSHSQAIIDSFLNGHTVHIFPDVVRFNGAKNTISKSEANFINVYNRSKNYGEWTLESMKLDFCPQPKRCSVEGNRLLPWFADNNSMSAEYDSSMSEDELIGRIAADQPK